MKTTDTDWNLVTQAQISINWLFECVGNQNSGVAQALHSFKERHEDCNLINPGILMAIAYITFVYPRETAINKIDVNRLDFSNFKLESTTLKPKDIIRRLRNAIAHGDFSVSPQAEITFKDNCRCGKDPFETKISCGHFGSFIQAFSAESKKQHFQRKK
jgi:hypothetical protein